jgi:hypothetical protein
MSHYDDDDIYDQSGCVILLDWVELMSAIEADVERVK